MIVWHTNDQTCVPRNDFHRSSRETDCWPSSRLMSMREMRKKGGREGNASEMLSECLAHATPRTLRSMSNRLKGGSSTVQRDLRALLDTTPDLHLRGYMWWTGRCYEMSDSRVRHVLPQQRVCCLSIHFVCRVGRLPMVYCSAAADGGAGNSILPRVFAPNLGSG